MNLKHSQTFPKIEKKPLAPEVGFAGKELRALGAFQTLLVAEAAVGKKAREYPCAVLVSAIRQGGDVHDLARTAFVRNYRYQPLRKVLRDDPTPNRHAEAFFARKMMTLHMRVGAKRMNELGLGTRKDFSQNILVAAAPASIRHLMLFCAWLKSKIGGYVSKVSASQIFDAYPLR